MSKKKQNTYWRSLNELAKNKEYQQFVEREFPEGASELKEGYSRRNFLQIMGASIALAGFAACRKPVKKIVPFTNMPEYMVPGQQVFYATSAPNNGYVTGLLVETNSGRPTKIEGNPYHPASKGATNIQHQAATLNLYDPDRGRFIRKHGERSTWNDFVSTLQAELSSEKRIAILAEPNSSPTINRFKRQILSNHPNAKWVTYSAFGEENQLLGSQIAFGRKLRVSPVVENARIIISLDADFMGASSDNVRNIRGFADGRRIANTNDEINRLYVVESNYSLTGSNADHRLRIKTADIKPFLYALASRLSSNYPTLSPFSTYTNSFSAHEWVDTLAEEIISNGGHSLLMAGADHDAETHAVVAAINLAAGNVGNTVTYLEVPHIDAANQHTALSDLTEQMRSGEIDALIMLGTNPAFTAPSNLNFSEALQNVPLSVHLGDYYEETSKLSTWYVNRAHFLEYWGDGYDYTGIPSIIQPMILPLFNGKSEIEVLGLIATGSEVDAADEVKSTWRPLLGSNFETKWQQVLHDGLAKDLTFRSADVRLAGNFTRDITSTFDRVSVVGDNGLEVTIKPDPKLLDGSLANNAWLQELPDPMTKITWDNVALVSPNTAEQLGVSRRRFGQTDVNMVSISANGNQISVPVWVVPGHADGNITIYAGYGRDGIGKVADGVGQNIYTIRTTDTPLFISSASVSLLQQTYDIATVQDHHSMEGRPLVREASLTEYREDPRFAADMVYVPGKKDGAEHPVTLFKAQTFPEHQPQWGMTIDLATCIGCGVCTIACQSENNIPVIGKEEVRRGREMHWMRTDRYFSGDENGDAKVVHQPVTCMHCELAPCEQVCPVAATTHSDDGLNQMTYNRCIGTRYCANNCPFKVRRFNFFNYPKYFLTGGDDPEVVQMAMNPDVSIRFRGIMEKCTYCVQRISRGKIATKLETGNSIKPADGTVKTACQQACPANAITFGDLTDEQSIVSRTKKNDRNYVMLEELGIRPRTSYLAKIRNTNEKLA
ncbi:MAG: TAT-variant-translocated molybdopterin oxidoreductase [Balneolales bacterium]|nr:TAT-variant-translocated molybdopterin oxidoreductase [Balneolales bacterium]